VLKEAGISIAPQTYYAAKKRPRSNRSVTDAETLEKIRRVHEDNYGVYGAEKVWTQLNREGHRVARCTVERLMRAAGLRGVRRGGPARPRTTVSGTGPDTREDLVERQFAAPGPNRLWSPT
jgi:putative transposase